MQSYQEKDVDLATFASLPAGAESIIRQIAAEQILHLLLDKVNHRESVDHNVILRVVKEFPGTCTKEYDFVWEDGSVRRLMPLAVVCCLRPPLETVEAVYQANPKAISTKEDFKGALPFHLACAFEAGLDVVKFMHDKYPTAIQTPRNDGVYAAHLANAFYSGHPSVVHFLLDEFPECTGKLCNMVQWSPLHSACHGGVSSVDLLQRMHQMNPAMIHQSDMHGRTPLHLAARSKQGNPQTIKFLVQTAPASLRVFDNFDGWTPLFLICTHQNAKTIASFLDLVSDIDPYVNFNATHAGASILHWAAIGNTAGAVEFLAQRFPQLLNMQTTDVDRDTPLSCAVKNRASTEIINVLVRRQPRALLIKDGAGRLPADNARRFQSSTDIVDHLNEKTNAIARFVLDRFSASMKSRDEEIHQSGNLRPNF